MDTVSNKEEAMKWFLEHSGGRVQCRRPDGTDHVADCYPAAAKFFDAQAEEVQTDKEKPDLSC